MRRWMAAPFLFATIAALILSADTPQAQAQGNDPVEETFLTADGVQLHGLFVKSTKTPGSDPVVILLYPPGKDNNMDKGDWKGLAKTLSAEGYNVLRFDWRGHGKSKVITDPARFWDLPPAMGMGPNPNPFTGPWHNAKMIQGAPTPAFKGKIKNDILFKDLKNPVAYAPAYLIDLAAARHHLDTKNDGGDVNTSSIYLIGSDTAAMIGFGWMTTEWNRPAFAPIPNQLAFMGRGAFPTYKYVPQPLVGGLPNELGGGDISGAIWLSAAKPPTIQQETLVKNWIAKGAPKLRENNPMLFLTAPKDAKAKTAADFFVNQVLVANPPKGNPLAKLLQTREVDVNGANTLSGVALLGADVGTEKMILQYLTAIQKNRARLIRKNRDFKAPWSILLGEDNNLGSPGFGFPRP